uniref:Uncharacterized protein n=1 Tax=Oryza rufipogon TaxID=4529 RepID=A0A0E0P1Q7_ORYRU
MLSSTALRPLAQPATATATATAFSASRTAAAAGRRGSAAGVVVRAVRNYDSIPKREPFSSSRSVLDEFLRQEKPLVQRTKDQITDYCTTLEGDECCSCWDAYFELNKLEQELPKEEIARMVKDSEGDPRYLINSIHHRSDLRKKMAEKSHNSLSSNSLGQAAKPRPFPVPDGLPKTQEELAEEQEALMPESSYTRLLRRMGRFPDWSSPQDSDSSFPVWEAARQQSQQLRLYTVEGRAAGYGTKWVELHPQSQELLLHIENKMREYKHESDLLDQCSRLYDPSVSSRSFELYATQISQEIGSTSTIMDREMVSIRSLMAVVEEMMRNTDSAIRSYQKLRPNFIRRYSGTANTGFAHHAGPSGAPTYFNQPSAIVPTFDFYSGVAMRPSPFMQHTVSKFENRLEECSRMVGELEQLIQIKNDKNYSNAFESLSTVVPNVYDYLIHVATQVENLHQYAEVMRTHYRNAWRLMGDCSDPFLEADRREAAKQEATARIVHPTGVDVSVLASQPLQSSSPTGVTSSSTRAILRTPLSALPWFSIQTSPAPSPSPFSSSGSMLQPTPFGSASTLALGSTPARFASSALGGTSLFRTPPGDALVFQTYSTQSVNCDYCTILSLTMPEKCLPTLTKSVTRQ